MFADERSVRDKTKEIMDAYEEVFGDIAYMSIKDFLRIRRAARWELGSIDTARSEAEDAPRTDIKSRPQKRSAVLPETTAHETKKITPPHPSSIGLDDELPRELPFPGTEDGYEDGLETSSKRSAFDILRGIEDSWN